jgi:hypothetical protein
MDKFQGYQAGLESPPSSGIAVTPDDGTDLTVVSRGLWVGGVGDVTVIFIGDTVSVTLKDVQGLLPGRIRRILATGTTATDIVALY